MEVSLDDLNGRDGTRDDWLTMSVQRPSPTSYIVKRNRPDFW
jgi:hypothetical protein